MLVYLRDGSAQTVVRAATLRWKLQIKLSTSQHTDTGPTSRSADPITPGAWQDHCSILTPGQPVPALILSRQTPGGVATGVPILMSLITTIYVWQHEETWKQ